MDHYVQNLKKQHAQKWSEYTNLCGGEDQEAFFKAVDVAFVNTIEAHFNGFGTLRFPINKLIIEVIIVDMIFNLDEIEGVARACTLSLFKLVKPDPVDNVNEDVPESYDLIDQEEYVAIIKTAKRFHLLVDTISIDASFRMGSRMLQMFKEHCGISVYGGCNDTIASNYYRVACAHSLQIIPDALHRSKVWTFSIALNLSTHRSQSYLNVRARFMVENTIYNVHLLAIPLFQSHTGENMFATTCKLLDALYPLWKEALIAVSSNGDRLMAGRTQGLLTRIDRVTSHGMIRV